MYTHAKKNPSSKLCHRNVQGLSHERLTTTATTTLHDGEMWITDDKEPPSKHRVVAGPHTHTHTHTRTAPDDVAPTVTGQLADAIGEFECLVFLFDGICVQPTVIYLRYCVSDSTLTTIRLFQLPVLGSGTVSRMNPSISTYCFRRVLKTHLFALYYCMHPAHWGFFDDNALYKFSY